MRFTNQDFSPPTQGSAMNYDLPPGTYTARISAEETKANKAGTGEYLQLTLTLEGDHAGRTIFDRLNLRNPSVKAMQIARETLQAIADAAGCKPQDSRELVGKRVDIETINESYQGKNYPRVRSYAPASGTAPEPLPAGFSDEDLPF